MKIASILAASLVSLLTISAASASTELHYGSNGYLSKISDLTLNGVAYNVSFSDISKEVMAANNHNVMFNDINEANDAAKLIFETLGANYFANHNINGCIYWVRECVVLVYSPGVGGYNGGIFNSIAGSVFFPREGYGYTGAIGFPPIDMSVFPNYTASTWTLASDPTSPIPEPENYIMLLVGLGILGTSIRLRIG
ncbi:PEP-CTERM sorting domain-containing protein [Duganella fentianensis]|uniref:PEP-CTERM sorting domain-containing protein n=1 Tax=Duganella fentianensis TaxID=2692177 RepID=UPI0032B20742